MKTTIDFSGCDQWEPSLVMVQDGAPSVSISSHWGWGVVAVLLLDSRRHLRLSGNGTVILRLWDKDLRSFLPAMFCHIKRAINSARRPGHHRNTLTGSHFFYYCSKRDKTALKPTRHLHDNSKISPLPSVISRGLFFCFMASYPAFFWKKPTQQCWHVDSTVVSKCF